MEESGRQPVRTHTPETVDRGFFPSLFDTRFDSLITPKMIRFLYVVGIVLLAIGALVVIVSQFAHSAGAGVVTLIVAPLVALLYLIMLRLWLELIVVAFKIRDAAEEVAANTRRA